LHGLIFELKERMNSRQDRPVMQKKEKEKTKNLFQAKTLLWLIKCLLCELTLKPSRFQHKFSKERLLAAKLFANESENNAS
jgi:hypothetical protein